MNRYMVEIEKQIRTVITDINRWSLNLHLQNSRIKNTPRKASNRLTQRSIIKDHIFSPFSYIFYICVFASVLNEREMLKWESLDKVITSFLIDFMYCIFITQPKLIFKMSEMKPQIRSQICWHGIYNHFRRNVGLYSSFSFLF